MEQYSDGRPVRFSYHPFASGLWIELVHTSFKSELAGWIAATLAKSGSTGSAFPLSPVSRPRGLHPKELL
jgi:hypothetical protein